MPSLRYGSLFLMLTILVGCCGAQGTPMAVQQPPALSLIASLQPLPANGGTYPSLIVAESDASGNPVIPLSSLTIFLSSSQERYASVPPSVILSAGHAYALVNVTTTETPGATVITAASSGQKTASIDLTTVAPVKGPNQLALFISPSRTLHSPLGSDALLAVELMNVTGLPADSDIPTKVVITSSNTSVVEGTMVLTIAAGESYGDLSVRARNPGTTTFTALASGLTSSSASLSILPAPLIASVTANPNLIPTNGTSTITVTVSLAGQALPNASVVLTTNTGVIVPARLSTDATGRAVATFTPNGSGVATIAAAISQAYVGSKNATATIVIPRPAPPIIRSPFQVVYEFIPVVVVIVLVAAIVLVVRRTVKRRAATDEEDEE